MSRVLRGIDDKLIQRLDQHRPNLLLCEWINGGVKRLCCIVGTRRHRVLTQALC